VSGPPRITAPELLERYEVLLLDAYGVLITHDEPLPGAAELIARLNRERRSYFVLTNDASRSEDASARRYREMGLAIPARDIITSGSVIADYFRTEGLAGARCAILGTEDSVRYVTAAGGEPVPAETGEDFEVLVVCDERGYPLRECLDAVLSVLYRRADRGLPTRLVLANPDLVYPAAPGRIGLTAGSVALLLGELLRVRYPGRQDVGFIPLGKPHPPMFREALRRAGCGPDAAVMIGDQLATDILGANRAGIASALVLSGLTRPEHMDGAEGRPTWILDRLESGA